LTIENNRQLKIAVDQIEMLKVANDFLASDKSMCHGLTGFIRSLQDEVDAYPLIKKCLDKPPHQWTSIDKSVAIHYAREQFILLKTIAIAIDYPEVASTLEGISSLFAESIK